MEQEGDDKVKKIKGQEVGYAHTLVPSGLSNSSLVPTKIGKIFTSFEPFCSRMLRAYSYVWKSIPIKCMN
jgi:hypothetical protein